MALLVELLGAKKALEIGTFTGYSALAVALALPPDGVLTTCDVSTEYTDIAKPFWEKAGVRARMVGGTRPRRIPVEQPVGLGDREVVDARVPARHQPVAANCQFSLP